MKKEYEKKKASTAKIAVIYTMTNVITRGMAFLTTPIFSRLMSKEEYGQFSNIASWVSILSVVVSADLYASITRAKYDFDEEIDEYLSSIMVLSNIITLFLYGIVEINMPFFENFFSIDATFIRFIFIYLMFWPASQFLLTKSRIYSKYKSVVAISCATFFSSTAASVALVFVLQNKLLARVIGNYLVVSIVNIILWAYILFKGKSCSKRFWGYALKLSLPLILHNLAGNMLNSSDRIIINKLCGPEDAALYSLVYTIAAIAELVLDSIHQAWTPWLFDKINENKIGIINKGSVVYTGIFSLFAAGIMLAAPEIVLIFGGQKYYEARFVIAPVVMGFVLHFVYKLYGNIEFYTKKTYLTAWGTVLATIINIFLNYICIPIWGYIAAAYTTICGYLFLALFHYLTVAWKCREYVNIYNKKAIIVSVLLMACMTALCLILYQHDSIRYIASLLYLVIAGILIYKKRKTILLLLNK